MEMYKKILILFLILLVGTIFLSSVSNATGLLSIDIKKGSNEEILRTITDGTNQYKIRSDIVNRLYSVGAFRIDGMEENTYKLSIEDGHETVIKDNNWLYCFEHGVPIRSGNYIIEKLCATTNMNQTTIRYARPTPIRTFNNHTYGTNSPKYYKYHSPNGVNSYAKYAGEKVSTYLERGTGWFNEYYKLCETHKNKAIVAYILSENSSSHYSSYEEYSLKDKKQRALWQYQGTLDGENELLRSARAFADYKENVESGTKIEGTAGTIYQSDYVLIGPLKVNFLNSTFTGFKSIRIYYNDDESKYIDINANNITNSAGNKITVSSGTNFYIKISNATIQEKSITKVNKVTADFKDLNVYALWSLLIQADSDNIQNQIVIYKAEREYGTISRSLNINQILTPPLKINITKRSTLDDSMMSGVGFNVKFEQSGSTTGNKTVTTTRGIANCEWQPSNRNEIKVTITETSLGTYEGNHQRIDPMEIRFTYDTSTNTWKMSSRTESSYLSVGSGSPVPVTIKNQYISPIVIGGDGSGFGGFNKVDQAGNPISGAVFKAVFTQGGSTLATRDAISTENGELNFSQVQPTTTGNVTVTITEESAPIGYVNSGFSKTIEFQYNTSTHTWEAVGDSTVEEKFESNRTYVELDNVVNASRIEKLTILKTDSQNGSKLKDAIFNITLENVQSVKGYSPSGSATQVLNGVTTNSQGKIELTEIVIEDVREDVVITIEETQAPVGYKKIDGKIIMTITRTGTQYKIVSSKDDNVLNEEFRDTVIDETGRVLGDVSGNGRVNSEDALLILKYSTGNMGLLDSSEIAKVEENGDLNGDGRITSEDAELILQYSVGLTSSTSNSRYFANIANGRRGDADSDGQITVNDALAVLKYSTDLATPNNAQRTQSDVNDDGNINSADALIILQYLNYANGPVNVIGHEISIGIKDIPGIEELVMEKADSQSRQPVGGATFKVSFENVRSVNGAGYTEGTEIETTTGEDGHFNPKIEKIIPQDANNPIIIHITETQAPIGYKKIVGTINLEVSRVDGKYKVTEVDADRTIKRDEFNSRELLDSDSELIDNRLNLKINNIPVMNLGGIVWEDEQTGDKNAEGYNSIYDEYSQDVGMSGIKIELYKSDGTLITKDAYDNDLMTESSEGGDLTYPLCNGETGTITLSKGQYVFPNIEKGSYYIRFTFDGIHYQTVNLSRNVYENNNESKVEEEGRDAFNEKFKTINDDLEREDTEESSYGKTGTGIELEYTNNNSSTGEIKTSSINITDDMYMTAKTSNYIKSGDDWKSVCWNNDGTIKDSYAQDINCGLVKKELDLGVYMQVDSTTLKINGKTTKYDHEKTLVENLKDAGFTGELEENMGEDRKKYTYLEYSDYYYRIDDYNSTQNSMKDANDEQNNDNLEDIKKKTNSNQELKVFVTYKVSLINQVLQEGVTVNELTYYYDTNYDLVAIGKTTDTETGEAINDGTITKSEEGVVLGKNAIKVSGFGETSTNNKSVIQDLYFTFEVKKTENSLPQAITEPDGLECANIVEITSYSTENSLIDNDSAPGNFVINNKPRYEDDTSKSNGLNISIKTTERTITGTVFDDTYKKDSEGNDIYDKDGTLNNNNGLVNDVIVQLIEIRSKKSGGLGEYIWQETISGSNTVKTTYRNGYSGTTYRYLKATEDKPVGTREYDEEDILNIYVEKPNENGQYEFTGFIPGNYIIRFIYGDGTTYDFDANGNIEKYNGQDYKSTIDPKYDVELFNKAGYAEGSSVARDNEARRLEVMSYSTMIDSDVGEALYALSKKGLSDLSDIEKSALDSYYKSLDKDNIKVEYALKLLKKFTNQNDITFSNINDENKYKLIQYYVSYNTWMCAETSRINVPIDAETTSIDRDATKVEFNYNNRKVTFSNVNFGLALRPQTKLVLEKHITGLKITPSGVGVQPIVDATADIGEIIARDTVNTEGITTGLATVKSTRTNRGFWQVATDIEELAQGAQLEVEYTYVIKNEGDNDYLSEDLVNKYVTGIENGTYNEELLNKSSEVRSNKKGKTHEYGDFLGQWYYNGIVAPTTERLVPSRVETLEEALNNDLKFKNSDYFITFTGEDRTVFDTNGVAQTETINTIVQTNSATEFLTPSTTNEAGNKVYTYSDDIKTVDYNKTIKLETVLSSSSGGELGANLPSYIAEVIKYSNAAGRRDMQAEPKNLGYVHSDDTEMTLDNSYLYEKDGKTFEALNGTPEPEGALNTREANEEDEFWGETIIITKPTGEDKLTPLQIAIITISSIAVIGVGIVLIKKIVLKK